MTNRSFKQKRQKRNAMILASIVAVFIIAVVGNTLTTTSSALPAGFKPAGWKLKWNDEFTGSKIEKTKWNVQNKSNYGSGNHEDECYMPGNVTVGGGSLRLAAKRQTVSCGATNPDTGNKTYYYTSGMVTTRAQGGSMKYKFKQGYIEARIKSPKGNPYWPAFWLVSPNDGSTPGWPDYGEMDIYEGYGARPDAAFGTFHYKCIGKSSCHTSANVYNVVKKSAYGGVNNFGAVVNTSSALKAYRGGTSDFVTYGLEWGPDKLTWYVNGRKVRYVNSKGVYRIEPDGRSTLENTISKLGKPSIPFSKVFSYSHSIIFNLAVGGNGPRYKTYGYTGYDTKKGYVNGNLVATNPGVMEVDYVRVYQPIRATTTSGSSEQAPLTVMPGDSSSLAKAWIYGGAAALLACAIGYIVYLMRRHHGGTTKKTRR
jgi:beta-glucanase (GH16 family)